MTEPEDIVVGVLSCADGRKFRVEVRPAETALLKLQVVWLMGVPGGGVRYARHGGGQDDFVTTSNSIAADGDWAKFEATQPSVLDFMREVGRRHTFVSWQPDVL